MKTSDLPDRCVSQLLSWCLEWLELPLYFAAQNTGVLAHSAGSAILLDVLAHTLPVVLASQEFRSPFIREMPSGWQIMMTADRFSPQGLVLGDVQTRLVPPKSVHISPPLNRFGFERKPSRILTTISSCKSICGSSCFEVREMPSFAFPRSGVPYGSSSRTRSGASRISPRSYLSC